MNILQIYLRPDRLVRFAAAQGIARPEDEDLGYACHAWLRAMFGDLAPKPFRLFDAATSKPARLLAYCAASVNELREHASTFADPLANAAWEEDSFAGRPMPDNWASGRRLAFEVLVCPMSRKDGTEKDIFLRRIDAASDATHDRAQIYVEWLRQQLAPAARLTSAQLAGFRRIRLMRRSASPGGGRRLVTLERPHARIAGELAIEQPAAFSALLARGIGRHRTFGYGMLLLSPPA